MEVLNRCPACRGWMVLDRDHEGWHVICQKCGYSHNLSTNEIVIEKRKDGVWENFPSVLFPERVRKGV
jgi:DNA-directed RNA polymerase subunit M/transcription elongation factor TFIIS